jgi:hypothetical protein
VGDLQDEGHEVGRHRVLRATSPAIPNAIAALLIHVRDLTGVIPDAYFAGRRAGRSATPCATCPGEGDTRR